MTEQEQDDGIIGRLGAPDATATEVQETGDLYAQVMRNLEEWPVYPEQSARVARAALRTLEEQRGNMPLLKSTLQHTATFMEALQHSLLTKSENIRRLLARLEDGQDV